MSEAPYIQSLSIKGWGCVKDASFELTRLHAFIGPNDSGKSTILRAVAHLLPQRVNTGLGPIPSLNEEIESRWHPSGVTVSVFGTGLGGGFRRDWPGSFGGNRRSMALRPDPDMMRRPTVLLPAAQRLAFSDDRGLGLSAIYDAIFSRNPGDFFDINNNFKALFPAVKAIGWRNADQSSKQLSITLRTGEQVSAEYMSEGMLYYLAFAALPYMDPVDVLLVEEPENGLHPSRIADVMRVLRHVSQTTQVLIATHSPLVINELQPDEVTVVTRDETLGTTGILMKNTPNFEARSKVYALGELWLSYANGVDEAPLLQDTRKT